MTHMQKHPLIITCYDKGMIEETNGNKVKVKLVSYLKNYLFL